MNVNYFLPLNSKIEIVMENFKNKLIVCSTVKPTNYIQSILSLKLTMQTFKSVNNLVLILHLLNISKTII